MAASATFALKAGLWFRRGRLFMVSPVRGDHRRFQAETPLIDLFKFAEPALFIDRALYLPKEWTDDPDRLEAAYVPPDAGFATKPKLATRMIARAIAASVPFKWVAGDTVYGVGDIEQQLRRAGKGYVLGVSSAHVFRSWGKRPPVAGTAADIARTRRSSDWKRLSAGAGTKGPRLHDWCYLELADLEAEQFNSV